MTWGTDKRTDASDVVSARNVADVATPGKRSRTQGQSYTGDPYIDHGAACEATPSSSGCFLPSAVRQRLIADLTRRISDAGHTYQDAITNVRVDTLLQHDDDLSWVATMLLDLVAVYASGKILDALKRFRAGLPPSADVVQEFWALTDAHAAMQTISVEVAPKVSMADRVRQVSDTTLGAAVGAAVGKAKTLATTGVTASGATPADTKAETANYLARLKDMAVIGYDQLARQLPATSDDAALIAYDESFQPSYHLPSAYYKELTDKLARFQTSGVTKIGRHFEDRQNTLPGGEPIDGTTPVRRDVRVAWNTYVSGYPKRLVYQHQDGERNLNGIRTDDQGAPNGTERHAFGPPAPVTDAPQNGVSNAADAVFYVPDEFAEVALQRHQLAWGTPPPVFVVDDSGWYWDPQRAETAQAKKASKVPKLQLGKAPVPLAVSDHHAQTKSVEPPIVVPDALKLKPDAGDAL